MRHTRFCARAAATLLAVAVAGAAFAGTTPAIISEGGANAFWRQVTPDALPPFPANAPDKSEDACVSIGYVIQANGTTSDFAMLKSWSSKLDKEFPAGDAYSGFSRGAVASVMQRRYVPAQAVAAGTGVTPVFTAATFAYSQRADADLQALRAHCVVEDLPGFVAKVQDKARKGGKGIRRAEMERQLATPQSPVN